MASGAERRSAASRIEDALVSDAKAGPVFPSPRVTVPAPAHEAPVMSEPVRASREVMREQRDRDRDRDREKDKDREREKEKERDADRRRDRDRAAARSAAPAAAPVSAFGDGRAVRTRGAAPPADDRGRRPDQPQPAKRTRAPESDIRRPLDAAPTPPPPAPPAAAAAEAPARAAVAALPPSKRHAVDAGGAPKASPSSGSEASRVSGGDAAAAAAGSAPSGDSPEEARRFVGDPEVAARLVREAAAMKHTADKMEFGRDFCLLYCSSSVKFMLAAFHYHHSRTSRRVVQMERARSLYHDTARLLLSRCLRPDAVVDDPVRGICLYLVAVCYLQTAELSYAIGKMASQELDARLKSVHQKLSTVNPVLTLSLKEAGDVKDASQSTIKALHGSGAFRQAIDYYQKALMCQVDPSLCPLNQTPDDIDARFVEIMSRCTGAGDDL